MQVQSSVRFRPVAIRHRNVLGGLARYLVGAVALGLLAAAVWTLSVLLGLASSVGR